MMALLILKNFDKRYLRKRRVILLTAWQTLNPSHSSSLNKEKSGMKPYFDSILAFLWSIENTQTHTHTPYGENIARGTTDPGY